MKEFSEFMEDFRRQPSSIKELQTDTKQRVLKMRCAAGWIGGKDDGKEVKG